MLDYLKVEVPKKVGAAWAKHRDLDFITPVNLKTGEAMPRSEAVYRELVFTIYPSGRATVQGSLHKLRHGQHNGGNFPAWAVADTIAELGYSFKFQPEQAQLRTLEFGLNVPLPASATDLLSRAVLYKTMPFNISHFGGKGYYLETEAQQYYFKLYDKERQLTANRYLAPGPLLRPEIKTRRMEWLADVGITTLADLTNPAKLAELGELLVEAFQQVLFSAVTIPAGLSKAEQRLLVEGRHPHYWQLLRKEHPDSLRKNRQRYRELTAKHTPDLLAIAALDGIVNGWEQLRTAPPCLPGLVDLAGRPFPELTDLPAMPQQLVIPGFNSLSIGVKPEKVGTVEEAAVRRCQTCGRDIAGQPASSKFCSEALYGKAAKRCRNVDSNLRNNTRRAVQRTTQQAYLFDVVPHLHLPATVREFVLSGLSWQVQRAQ